MVFSDRHAIVGEVGAHHLRFAVSDVDELTIDHLVNFRTQDFDSVQQALFSYLQSVGTHSKVASLAVAGSVDGDRVHIFNSAHTFTKEQFRTALSLDRVEVVTDAEAVAKVAAILPAHDLHQIAGTTMVEGPRAVIVIGEGMRSAIAAPDGGGNWVLSTEAGSMSLGAADEEDLWFIGQVREELGEWSAGSMLSAEGLLALYKAASRQAAVSPSCSSVSELLAEASERQGLPSDVALDRYARWLARFSRDFAVATGAWGGLYLAGELPAELVRFLEGRAFKMAFQPDGGASRRAPEVPVHVVTSLSAALRGAAMAIA